MVGLQPERKGTTKKARGKTLAGKKETIQGAIRGVRGLTSPCPDAFPKERHPDMGLYYRCGIEGRIRFPLSETVHDFRLFGHPNPVFMLPDENLVLTCQPAYGQGRVFHAQPQLACQVGQGHFRGVLQGMPNFSGVCSNRSFVHN